MLYWFIPLGLVAVFFGWILYHLLIKKDLRKYTSEMSFGFFFIGLWAVIYWLTFK